MASAKRFEDLEVWQKAKELTILIYRLSSSGSFSRDFGLRDQMRRASVSIMSNIAEGFESQTQALFIQYLWRAQLYIAFEQDYLAEAEFNSAFSFAEICSKQLARFIQYLETQPNARRLREDGTIYDV
jgi:four helix bundle protein